MASHTSLRNIDVLGPDWNGTPFWRITVGAPHLYKYLPEGTRRHEDRIFPVRALMIDAANAKDTNGFRSPRLVSAHVIAGDNSAAYGTVFFDPANPDPNAGHTSYPPGFQDSVPPKLPVPYIRQLHERLTVTLSTRHSFAQVSKKQWSDIHDEVSYTTPAYFLTGSAQPQGEPSESGRAAEFQHVILAPLVDPATGWPPRQGENIFVPPMRLNTGTIHLAVADKGFEWLVNLQPDPAGGPSTKKTIHRFDLLLVPDGIEMALAVPFPGQNTPLRGKFLLAPEGETLILTLLPEKLSAEEVNQWRQAWNNTLPHDQYVESLHGFRIAGNKNTLPRFRWHVSVNEKGLQPLKAVVEVPVADLRMELISPRGAAGIEGVVSVGKSEYFILTTVGEARKDSALASTLCGPRADLDAFSKGLQADTILIGWSRPDNQPAHWITFSAGADGQDATVLDLSLHARDGTPYRCAHDERRLAQALRDAYDIETPAPDEKDPKPATLYGFVPMADGWLQLPIPNFPPPNLALDNALLPPAEAPRDNTLDGYLRFSKSGNFDAVLSAFTSASAKKVTPSTLIDVAPWSVTIESATGLRVVVAIGPTDSKAENIPLRAQAQLDEPELSTRGLLWFSGDRPDALEALPRLGAGPGKFLDVPLERWDTESEPSLDIGITRLELAAKAGDGAATITRKALTLEIDGRDSAQGKSRDALYWRRHPRMPLIAAMPMTRSARSASRALESRDLIPFSVTSPDSRTGVTRLARLSWHQANVYPAMEGTWKYRVDPDWTWPNPLMKDPGTVKGIGLCAFGVPGVELRLAQSSPMPNPWDALEAAPRFDLPTLDEAFATASLPPAKDAPTSAAIKEKGETVATALDWDGLISFWHEQERKLQLSRVNHSYLTEYRPAGLVAEVAISSVVRGLTWRCELGFVPATNEALSYGHLVLKGEKYNGNKALCGFSGTLSLTGLAQEIEVLGYSPASFTEGDYRFDARGVGEKPWKEIPQGLWRALKSLATDPFKQIHGRITSAEPINVYAYDDNTAPKLFSFWYKDIPLRTSGDFLAANSPSFGVDGNVWQDDALQEAGSEWRLLGPPDQTEKCGDRILFEGLLIEPLRLESISFDWDAAHHIPKSAVPLKFTILARIHLGPAPVVAMGGDNRILLEFATQNGRSTLTGIRIHDAPLQLPISNLGTPLSIGVGGVQWSNGQLKLLDASITFEFLGHPVSLSKTKLTYQNNTWEAAWTADHDARDASISITSATAVIRADSCTKDPSVKFEITHQTILTPVTRPDEPVPDTAAITILVTQSWPPKDDEPAKGQLELLEVTCPVNFIPVRDGFCITSSEAATGAILWGFPSDGKLSFGLAARVDGISFKNSAFARLSAGYLSGSLTALSPSRYMELARIDFRARCNARGTTTAASGKWIGELTLYGKVEVPNAIAWPGIKLNDEDAIPFSGEGLKTGCIDVHVDGDTATIDDVQWLLNGHQMAFTTARSIANGDATTTWSVPVVARHTLTTVSNDEQSKRSFTGVEVLSLGPVEAIVPRYDPAQEIKQQGATLFAGYDNNRADGAIGSVLQGVLGKAFRQAFYAKQEAIDQKAILVSGGFLGTLMAASSNASAPLLRLPCIAALGPGTPVSVDRVRPILQTNKGKPVQLAWPDSGASAFIQPSPRSSVTPKESTERSLLEALRGSGGGVELAAIVEQAFPVDLPSHGLEQTSFFISSAISLARTLAHLGAKDKPITLSLLAGRIKRNGIGRTVAGSLLLSHSHGEVELAPTVPPTTSKREVEPAPTVPPTTAELALVGDDLVTEPWLGNELIGADGNTAAINMRAFSLHVRPRAALLRDRSGDFHVIELRVRELQPKARSPQSLFYEDAARGYPYPIDGAAREWLRGVQETGTAAARDAKTGIPAMSCVVDLPAHAANPDKSQRDNGLVWVGQQRVPVYLPLTVTSLKSAPIPWLVPGAPRTRLPAAHSIEDALVTLKTGNEAARNWQPFVPRQAMTAAISERPGILMVRRMRLEKAANLHSKPSEDRFDPLFDVFGRAAQASASHARTERTPRPGPLPENNPDRPQFNRRPCVSTLLPLAPLRAFVGPADVVRGAIRRGESTTAYAWNMSFVASPQTGGMVIANWDGTLAVVVELDVEKGLRPNNEPWKDILAALVFGAPETMIATLCIGQNSVAFRAVHFGEAAEMPSNAKDVDRVHIPLTLDARTMPTTTPGPALPAIVSAMSTLDHIPDVEIRWRLYPAVQLGSITSVDSPVPLWAKDKQTSPANPKLPFGKDRAPVTLRIPLFPVVPTRGALPLEPLSLLFVDPAYDMDLAAPPAEDARRLVLPKEEAPPKGRGALLFVLSGDRQRMNRKGTLTVMADIRFERRLDERQLERISAHADGDLKPGQTISVPLTLRVQSRSGEVREVFLTAGSQAVTQPPVLLASTLRLAAVHEIVLSDLVEKDGASANLQAGEILEVIAQCPRGELQVLEMKVDDDVVQPDSWVTIKKLFSDDAPPPTRTLRVVLTDEPVVEPPPASYAALVRSPAIDNSGGTHMLSVPLYAQSPLPYRVNLEDAKADFRRGLMKRNATFIWTLMRTREEGQQLRTFIVKSDRNGQTYLPENENEFIQSERLKTGISEKQSE